jgi:Spy/CpxP family protein refolding chaperone
MGIAKSCATAGMAMLTLTFLASAAIAQSPQTRPATQGANITLQCLGGTMEDLVSVCNVSAEQQKKIQDVEAAQVKFAAEMTPLMQASGQAMMKAYSSKDPDAIAKAQKESGALYAKHTQQYTKSRKDTLAVLTQEQRTKWLEYTTLKGIKSWVSNSGYKLSDAQWDKVLDAYEKLANSSTPSDQVWMKLWNKLMAEIITPRQKAERSAAWRFGAMEKVCHFTDQQTEKILKIEEARAKAHDELEKQTHDDFAEMQKGWMEMYQSGDQNAVAQVQKQYAEYNKPFVDLDKEYDDKVQALLTDKQKAAWQEQLKNSPQSAQGIWMAGGASGWPASTPKK